MKREIKFQFNQFVFRREQTKLEANNFLNFRVFSN